MRAIAERFAMRVAAAAQRERTLRNFVLIAHPLDDCHIVALNEQGSVRSHFDRRHGYPIFCIAASKSPWGLVLPSLSRSGAIASTWDNGLSTWRGTRSGRRSRC